MHGEEKWPLQRGFERFYGILAGACSYLRPSGGRGLTLDNTKLPEPEAPYYTTDAFTDYAIRFVDEQKDDKPFFLYLAFNAPHWPLQAKEEDIQKFTKIYREKGWDEIREARRKRMTKLGIIDPNTEFAEWENRKWDELTEKEKDEVAYRMAVYAAQVHCVDYNVGKLLDYLKKNHKLDNTLVMFLSDNGACAEPYAELGGGKVSEINNPACSVFPSYGRAWAQVSNTPFRKYKCRSYEGGISTPLIVSWKSNLKNKKGEWCRVPGYLPDIMPTILEATGAAYPETYHGGNKIYPLVGSSLFPAIQKKADSIHEYMYWEHQNNRAIRWGNWKAIRDEKGKEWELYDVVKDRTERNNLAEQHPEVLTKLVAEWEKWANANFVPETAEGRIEVAKKIYRTAAEYGIGPEDIVIDALCLTVSSDSQGAITTLETLRRVRDELHGKTILGVSNISFGLPQREIINAAFFTMAMQNGLSAAIINPNSEAMMRAYYSFRALMNLDPQCSEYISVYSGQVASLGQSAVTGNGGSAAGSVL